MTTNNIAVLYTTVSTAEQAERLAHLALAHHVAVCVNIIPQGQSIYLWEGRVEQCTEYYMLFKTGAEMMDVLEELVTKNHPYDIPSVLKLTVESTAAFTNYISQSILQSGSS